MKTTKIELIMTIGCWAGVEISNYLKDALAFIKENNIKQCYLAFNGWIYLYNDLYKEQTATDLINKYMAYSNKGA